MDRLDAMAVLIAIVDAGSLSGAARKLGADPRRCLVVEDAEAGVRAGRAAGATVAALKSVPADIQIAGLYQLSALLREACVTRRT